MLQTQPFWSIGDLCIYKCPNVEDYVVGRVKEINQAESGCQVETFSSSGLLYCPVNELYSLTRDTVKMIKVDDISCSSLIEAINESFFLQKFEKLLSVRTMDEKEVLLPKTCHSIPVTAVRSDIPETRNSDWQIGDLCICQWSEDEEYYYAIIVKVSDSLCTVSFCHYANEEDKHFGELHRVGSPPEALVVDEDNRKAFQQLQISVAGNNTNNSSANPKIRQTRQSPSPRPVRGFSSGGLSSPKTAPAKQPIDAASQSRHRTRDATPPDSGDPCQQPPHNSRSPPLTGPQNSSGVSRPPAHLLPPAYPSQLFADLKQTPWQAMLISWFMCGYHTGFYEALHQEEEKKQ